jgi:hypothetical protein
MELYIKAKSKKELNEKIAKNIPVYGDNYSIFGGGGTYNILDVPHGTVIKLYQKTIGGNPFAEKYGNWNANKKIIY